MSERLWCREIAEKIVDAVLADLKRRKAIGNELESIEPAIYAEMRDVLITKVADIQYDHL